MFVYAYDHEVVTVDVYSLLTPPPLAQVCQRARGSSWARTWGRCGMWIMGPTSGSDAAFSFFFCGAFRKVRMRDLPRPPPTSPGLRCMYVGVPLGELSCLAQRVTGATRPNIWLIHWQVTQWNGGELERLHCEQRGLALPPLPLSPSLSFIAVIILAFVVKALLLSVWVSMRLKIPAWKRMSARSQFRIRDSDPGSGWSCGEKRGREGIAVFLWFFLAPPNATWAPDFPLCREWIGNSRNMDGWMYALPWVLGWRRRINDITDVIWLYHYRDWLGVSAVWAGRRDLVERRIRFDYSINEQMQEWRTVFVWCYYWFDWLKIR